MTQLQLGGNTTQYKNIKLQKYKDRNRYTSGSQLHLGGKTGAIQKYKLQEQKNYKKNTKVQIQKYDYK